MDEEICIPENSPFTPEQEERITHLMKKAIDDYFSEKGRTWKNVFVTLGVLAGSLTAIVIFVKMVLAFIGVSIIHK